MAQGIMMNLDYVDWREDLLGWSRVLGICCEALEIYTASDVIDLHIESYIWTRLFNYDLAQRHDHGFFGARFYSQVDIPRLREARLTGAVFSIATNPLRRRSARTPMLLKNLADLQVQLLKCGDEIEIVSGYGDYVACKARGKLACWLAIQGGNALDSHPDDLSRIPNNCISRITLVHLTNSSFGRTSAPLDRSKNKPHLTTAGADFIQQINAHRIALDLSHISERGFWQALDIHDRSQPAIVSHTGVRGVHSMWRNITDAQIRAIADLNGVVGIIFHTYFLSGGMVTGCVSALIDHIEHVINVVGDEFVALGSDWDGLISTPRDMPTVLELPVLVQHMLDRNWTAERIQRVLGGNYLRVMQSLRP